MAAIPVSAVALSKWAVAMGLEPAACPDADYVRLVCAALTAQGYYLRQALEGRKLIMVLESKVSVPLGVVIEADSA